MNIPPVVLLLVGVALAGAAVALAAFAWAVRNGHLDPVSAATAQDLVSLRSHMDERAALPVLLFFTSAVFWLVAASVFGLASSIKFDLPDWLGSIPALTFGRLRPAHLNAAAYGWASLAAAGCVVWLTSRLCLAPVRLRGCLLASAALWNLGMVLGIGSILLGYSQSVEWLEFPLPAAAMIAVAFLLLAASVFATFRRRTVEQLYVSLWYILGAMVWFPLLYVTANLPIYSGVTHGAVNWWYGHNALGTWFTPIGLALAYYFIPKVIGRPIYSYYLSLLGFWAFALFYNWNGIHHLVGGPVPNWLQTISIIASVMMGIPVMAVAVNHHLTTVAHFRVLRTSPTLRFTVFGAMCYTAVSVQGSAEALRGMQEVVHFTHYTVGHAHLGAYAFLTMILFGAFYYITPRVARWNWPRPGLIKLHFWLTAGGILLYGAATCVGGWFQGLAMNNPAKPFVDVVAMMRPYLHARTVSGCLLTAGHLVFAYQFACVVLRRGPKRLATPWGEAQE
ncbi:MAG: cbb3-type cytochrome c oxidase subunit I [Acidobacteriota bacterium]